ncbi:MAG TPA: cyclic pyranopterin monophosphate synthase MoaC [Prolixibacteraceae bacterium]|nr:cyclic pyranopterin monophosphate synthase MoaC [Prolixibacteraceae bacterium]HCR91662.1 cyclic pyranopterin monophosphate synthase MoaC [Prolixibacteraceae bacterium]HCU63945.1 cyclic pyranopterin monophosphate synthase MoaC [Prolixibacteraceae bacterium]
MDISKKQLTHTDEKGRASMVDVSGKPDQIREATASGIILLQKETLELIQENKIKKGDVLTVAEIAGIQAAKKTSELIPLCHPLQISKINVTCSLVKKGIEAVCTVKCTGQTGVEMEALTGVNIALLTIYDMCKAVDKSMVISDVRLLKKTKK